MGDIMQTSYNKAATIDLKIALARAELAASYHVREFSCETLMLLNMRTSEIRPALEEVMLSKEYT